MAKENTQSTLKTRSRVHVPRRYHVVLHNDDITTMDFVVKVLRVVFLHPMDKATELMLRVHHEGAAVVGTYSYDIAITKASKVTEMARNEGYPLQVSVSEA